MDSTKVLNIPTGKPFSLSMSNGYNSLKGVSYVT